MISEKLKRHFDEMLDATFDLPDGIEWLLPLRLEMETRRVFNAFLDRFYHDTNLRTLILGINPGRFGAGVTNVAFTDPIHLEKYCGIENSFPKREELSAQYIYKVVNNMGGAGAFYARYFVNSVIPFGFVNNGKNFNYYDSKELEKLVRPIALKHIGGLLELGMNVEKCFCLGEDKNFKFLSKLNGEYGFFREVIPLPHPRFIMQYRRKRVEDYANKYVNLLN
jgi:hypothetical protein